MKILIRKLCTIFVAALFISPVYATSFQLDFTTNWNVTHSILHLGAGGGKTLLFSSLFDSVDIKGNSSTAHAADISSAEMHNVYMFSAINMGFPERASASKLWIKQNLLTGAYVSDIVSLSGMPTVREDLKPDVSSAVIQLIDDQGFDFNAPFRSTDSRVLIAMASSVQRNTEEPGSSYSFLTARHLRTQSFPDPSPVWMVGLMLGITGVAWRLLNLPR
jgi:hypothetical protein